MVQICGGTRTRAIRLTNDIDLHMYSQLNGEWVDRQTDRKEGIHVLIGDPGQLLGDLKRVQFRLKWDIHHTHNYTPTAIR